MYETRALLVGMLLGMGCTGPALQDPDVGDPPDLLDLGVQDVGEDAKSDVSVSDMMLYRGTGAICSAPIQCAPFDLCTAAGDNTFRCLRQCDTAFSLCEGGEVCTPLENLPTKVCYPGGRTPARRPCDLNLDCERGHLCLGEADERYCIQACDAATGEGCDDAQECVKLGATKGYCRDLVGRPCEDGGCEDLGLTCTTNEGSGRADALFPQGVCTTQGCERDADCPGDAACRVYADGAPGLCVDRCTGDADCRFTRGFRCLGNPSCEEFEDFEGCRAFFGPELLCVHAP